MVKKSEFVKRLLVEVKPRGKYPKHRCEGFTLLEEGLKVVLMRHLPEKKAESSVASLREGFVDWNEARVSQAQEIATHLKTGSHRSRIERLEEYRAAAIDVKTFLQEIFQVTHGLDLETSCEDRVGASKALMELPTMGQTIGGYLLFHSAEGAIPMHKVILKLCQKLDLIGSTTSLAKGLNMLLPLVPKGQEREFVLAIHEVADRWYDGTDPIFVECDILRTCAFGKKAHAQHLSLLKRLEAKAIRDERKRVAQEARDALQARRDAAAAEKERKRLAVIAEQEAAKQAKKRERAQSKVRREAERRAKIRQREADVLEKAEAKKKAAAKKIADAKKRAAAKKKAASKKIADAKNKAAAKKKADAKKAADAKKKAAKKAAEQKKADAKKAADAKKKAAMKMADDKRRAASKKSASTKKGATAKKSAPKKPTAKKPTAKKPTAKKATAKKPAAKKKSASKKR